MEEEGDQLCRGPQMMGQATNKEAMSVFLYRIKTRTVIIDIHVVMYQTNNKFCFFFRLSVSTSSCFAIMLLAIWLLL